MKAAGAVVAVVAMAAFARPAIAGSCGGGGDSDGGSSSSGSDSSSSDSSSSDSSYSSSDSSSSSSEPTPACLETSDVVGRQQCGSFGDNWGGTSRVPPIIAELGTFSRRIDPRFSGGGVLAHDGGAFAYSVVPGERDSGATAVGMVIRLGSALPSHLYAGIEGEIGGVVSDGGADIAMLAPASDGSMPSVTTNEALFVGGGAYAGVRGRFGRLSAAAEVGAGARAIQLHVDSRYGDCVVSEYHYDASGYVEPRVRADYWVNPWLTVGGYAGTDLEGRLATMGLTLAAHVRAFDGNW
jgi:hypothetical protein